MKTIEEVVGNVEEWNGKKVDIKELTAGLTNKNYKVDVDGKSYVVRIPGERTDIFIFKYFKPEYIVIMEFLDGKVMSVDSFKNHNYTKEAVEAIRKVNTEARFVSKFIMFDKFDHYLEIFP